MRQITLLLFALGTTFTLNAQFQKSVKLYLNTLYFNSTPIPEPYEFESAFLKFQGISPAIRLENQTSGRYHELEWSNLRFKKQEGQIEDVKEFLIGFRYEYGKQIAWNFGSDKITCSIGGAARLFRYTLDTDPNVLTGSFRDYRATKVVLGFVPRLQYQWKERIYFDINTSLSVFNIGYEADRIENPFTGSRVETTDNWNTEFLFLDEFLLRVGVGYQF